MNLKNLTLYKASSFLPQYGFQTFTSLWSLYNTFCLTHFKPPYFLPICEASPVSPHCTLFSLQYRFKAFTILWSWIHFATFCLARHLILVPWELGSYHNTLLPLYRTIHVFTPKSKLHFYYTWRSIFLHFLPLFHHFPLKFYFLALWCNFLYIFWFDEPYTFYNLKEGSTLFTTSSVEIEKALCK